MKHASRRSFDPTALLLAGCLCAGVARSGVVLPKGYSHEELQAAIDVVESRGELLYKHNHAAQVASREVNKFREFRGDKRVAGWITEAKDGDSIVVTFVGGREGESPGALYRATVNRDGKLDGKALRMKAPQPLTEFESAAAAARRFALASGFESCAERYSTVVLPAESEANRTWLVFLLPETTKPNAITMGGTHRLEIDWYSERVISTRNFEQACRELPYNSSMAALYVMNRQDEIPTEAQVYWSLTAGLSLIVSTASNDLLWAIEQGVIRQLDDGAPKR